MDTSSSPGVTPPKTSTRTARALRAGPIGLATLAGLGWAGAHAAEESAVPRLDEFVVRESAQANLGDIAPTSRPVGSLYGDARSVLEIPRSVTVLTPEVMRQFHLESFADFAKVGAGTQHINYYGVPGTPTLRGARGGVYFNGMQRAYNRNEMPLSFGSLDAIDIVKGPAPAHFGPGLVGGFVNLIPKLPYFDKARGSLELTVGSGSLHNAQLDYGGPSEALGRPAAFRVSLTAQRANSYYDRVGNDYVSLYASGKAEIAKGVTVFTGGEFYDFKSNENSGWNRPTQSLIDNGSYIIGEPVSIVSPAWGGTAVRSLLETPGRGWVNPLVHALAIPGDVARARIPDNLRALMVDMNTQAGLDRVYSVNPSLTNPQTIANAQAVLAQIPKTPQDVYVYTPEYLSAGGEVLTDKIDASTVLAGDQDYADSRDFLYFLDFESNRAPDLSLKNQFLAEWVETEKRSTYGYAIQTEQWVFEDKLTATQHFDVARGMTLTYGASARYTDAFMLQDFFAEPFSRRDISASSISANSILPVGGQRGPNGLNFWSPTAQGGANAHSKLWQFSGFATAENQWTDRLTTFTSVLVAHAPFKTEYPKEVDRVPASDPRRLGVSNHKNYYNAAFSPTFRLAKGLHTYVTVQEGTALDPLQGGAIIGKGNFSRNRLQEAGLKASLLEDKLFAGLSAYQWRQTAFDERSNSAEPLKGKGVEFETTWLPLEGLSFLGSAGVQRVQRLSPLTFRAYPLTAEQWALWGGVLNTQFGPAVFNPTVGAAPPANPDLVYPGTPQVQAKLFARYQLPNGLGVAGGPVWSRSYWHNFDRTLRIPSSTVWNFNVFLDLERWSFLASVENAFGEDYFYGAEPVFGANTLITKAPETPQWKFSATFRF